MPLIPFPNVPNYPGVPSIPRRSPGTPQISIALAAPQNPAVQSKPYADSWGIFNSDTNEALYSPSDGSVLSFFSYSFSRQMQISDFPIEANSPDQGAAFASFNKVFQPANPIVTLILSGSEADKQDFLAILDFACRSTNLYMVTTPEGTFGDYSIESYSYERTAQRGATLLKTEISMKEILQVQPYYSNPEASTAINDPQSPSAVAQANGGLVQAQPYTGSSAGVIGMIGESN